MGDLKGNKVVFVGLQYGSEAKGLAIERLTQELKPKYAVRTGAINAGHSVYYKGQKYAMQTIPVSWIDPTVKLVLGASAIIDPGILEKEIKLIEKAQPDSPLKDRLFIDQNCYVQAYHHTTKEKGMHETMGSTGKGCGEALVEKIQRARGELGLFRNSHYGHQNNKIKFQIVDTVEMLLEADANKEIIFLEGTQGTELDLHLGVYPFVTSRMTTASAWLAEAGLPPKGVHVIGVARTFPIRVAGNSGPFRNEISWDWLARDINKKRKEHNLPAVVNESALVQWDEACKRVAEKWRMPSAELTLLSPEQRKTYYKEVSNFHAEALSMLAPEVVEELKKLFEMTTVTKKIRRIAHMDALALKRAININGVDEVVLNFFNYYFPESWGLDSLDNIYAVTNNRLRINRYLEEINHTLDVPITYISTSAQTFIKL